MTMGSGDEERAVATELEAMRERALRAERALHNAERNQARIVECTDADVMAIDRDYRITFVNANMQARFQSVLGHSINVGDAILEQIPVFLVPSWKARYDRAFAGERVVLVDEYEDEAGKRYYELSIAPMTEADGSISGACVFTRDVSRYVEIEKELERRVEERTQALEEANAELQAFTYSVSHDLRAPVRHARGFAELLREHVGEDADAEIIRLVGRIDHATQHMSSIIDALLELAQLGRATMRPTTVDVSNLVRDVVDELGAGTAAVSIAPGMTARGDARMLRILFQNLLENAFKFTSRVEAPAVDVSVEDTDTGHWFVVRDNGVGFDSAKATELFKPFERLHSPSEYRGSGIGLATAKRIVERHGGNIEADATPGAGASFRFTI